ncbi:hypothetical protein [uncultured Paraglaciecola sp.]|uniref:hypothetical protein n=1 Tax=uncultured Paraglaciecola sp. TaxID=1765024 RepID=UPI00261E9811|nr:hypothetical protein [uncultured Paraglaciecola sp.]
MTEIMVRNRGELVGKVINDPIFHDWPSAGFKITVEPIDEQRTLTQNNCIWQWGSDQAIICNDSGLERNTYYESLAAGVEAPWTKSTIIDDVWRVAQKAYLETTSTRDMKTKDPSVVYDVVNRKLTSLSIPVAPWPTRFNQ